MMTPHRHGFDETFEVLVGSGSTQERFTVHSDIFVKRSRVLEAARSSTRRSDPKTRVDLTDADPDVFADSMLCVYHDKVAAPEGAGWPFPPLF